MILIMYRINMLDLRTNNIDNVNAKKDAVNEVAMSIKATSHLRN
ncbi:hypothetical protein EC847_107144 [Scandinavium goeteborgense]|uniref:Uncharacterized protein n=1 Tax=Scandinavium goeteborgense TaxID=1851514 RepID=A0A4R6EGV7_SCAGO|nr:hypothetical protein EC847_107144 [Scandinavium goeteborgense]